MGVVGRWVAISVIGVVDGGCDLLPVNVTRLGNKVVKRTKIYNGAVAERLSVVFDVWRRG